MRRPKPFLARLQTMYEAVVKIPGRNIEESPANTKPETKSDVALRAGGITGAEIRSHEQRAETRYETGVTGRLRLPASEHDCQLADISMGGMSVIAPDAALAAGLQVTVLAQGLPQLIGTVRWMRDDTFGMQFIKPITPDVLATLGEMKRRVRSVRAPRIKLTFPTMVFFDGEQHQGTVRNISVSGLMFNTTPLPGRKRGRTIRNGQALMVQLTELLPIGGHVRWTCGSQCGIMFAKLLPVALAQEIIRLNRLDDRWLNDVRAAHIMAGGL